MIRIVLVGWNEQDWRLYRQPQWMAELRRSPDAANLPRLHFDIEEEAYRIVLESWEREGARTNLEFAKQILDRQGAVEIGPP